MSAKPNKKPYNCGNNDIKVTAIIVLCVIVAIQGFLLFNKKKPVTAPAMPVVKHVTIEPVEHPSVVVAPSKKREMASGPGKIAFILDDWGYTMRNCKFLSEIKEPLAISILPNLKHTNDIEACAGNAGKLTMLHLPMEPYRNNDRYPDNYLLTVAMKPAKVERLLEDILNKMPNVQGVNNHMGSRATEDKTLMTLVFKHLKKRKLFFVDSMTSPHHSVCAETAAAMNLPFGSRDVFLDNINTHDEIVKQILSLAQKAKKKGYAVAIGHDRELTLKVIKEQIPILEAHGFKIVSIKDLLK